MSTTLRLLVTGCFALLASACGREEPRPAETDPAQLYREGVQSMEAGHYAEAYCRWRPLADAGHADAQYSIGWMYANGRGMAVSEAEAVRWWRMAAEGGHAEAQFSVARALLYGEGVSKDPAAAVPWLERAAGQGVEEAQDILRDLAGRGEEAALALVRERLVKGGWRALGGVRRVKVDQANLRAGIGTDKPLTAALDVGIEVQMLSERADWVRIGIPGSGTLGWIYGPLLEAPAAEP